MPNLFLMITLAQAEGVADAVPELSSSQALAGMLGLSGFLASLFFVIRGIIQVASGQQLMPAARRQPLFVSTPIAVLGVCVASLLALVSLLATEGEGADPPKQDAVAVESSDDLQPNKGEEAVVSEEDQRALANDLARRMIEATVGMNGVLLLLFGSLIVFAQQFGPGRALKVLAPTSGAVLGDERPSEVVQPFPVSEFPDDSGEVEWVEAEPWNLWTELKFAGHAFLLALVPTVAVRLIVLSFMPEPKSHQFIEMMNEGMLSSEMLLLFLLTATLVAPVVEELLYRVVVLGGLWNRRGPIPAVIVSSVVFSFAHGFPDSIALLPLALMLGYTYVQRRSYRTVMLVHFIFNAFNMTLAFLGMGAT